MREFITGNQAIVRGALASGCDYFAGYPITPASSILVEMMTRMPKTGGTAIQTEDELAAIGQCIGAAMGGAKAMTATSGPGLSLYSENIGLAQMGEVPLVIVDCQRMGPSTGGATASGDGDVVFARHVTAGSYPLPVLAATDAETAYRLTRVAFNIAEELRTPVILLSSKAISMTRQTADLERIELPEIVNRRTAPIDEAFTPYAIDFVEDIPAFAPIGGPQRVRSTGSIHDEHGVLTVDRNRIDWKLTHLHRKITARRDCLEFVRADIDPDAHTLILSYGTANGAAAEAVERLRDRGVPVSHLTLYSLWPMPEGAIRRAITHRIQRVLIPEINIGLYASELGRVFHNLKIESILQYDGGLIEPERIEDRVANWPCG
ncbi:MAG: pyruvate flavodoxin/ferredoxin oxidoreductase [Phycisphaerae bacterium]